MKFATLLFCFANVICTFGMPVLQPMKMIETSVNETYAVDLYEEGALWAGWGGSCTCPGGQVYQVADNWDACGSLACINGISGTCNRRYGPWSYNRVTCASVRNIYQIGGMISGWGGSCTCPNGEVFQVADNNDSCGSLACIDGTSGTCNRAYGPWSNNRVYCGDSDSPVSLTLTVDAIR